MTVTVGDKWRLIKTNPFDDDEIVATVLAVLDGFVKYSFVGQSLSWSIPVNQFVSNYVRISQAKEQTTMTDEFGTIQPNDLPTPDQLEEKQWFEKGVKQPDEDTARIAAIHALAQPNRRRADWAYNPNDVFICPNGHLQYNLNDEELAELQTRGIKRPPICYDGGLCRNCAESIEKLTADPKELQGKLGVQLQRAAALQLSVEPYKAVSDDMNRIAKFLRENYEYEMHSGQSQHDGNGSKAVIHYLRIERARPSVQARKMWRAVMRMLGVV